MTDINLIQTPYEEGHSILNEIYVHKGFLTAFRSVRASILQLLSILFETSGDDDVGTNTASAPNTATSSTTTSTATTSTSATVNDTSAYSNTDSAKGSRSSSSSSSSSSNSVAAAEGAWSIFVTGHSLGGALATLMAFELGRINAGSYVCVCGVCMTHLCCVIFCRLYCVARFE